MRNLISCIDHGVYGVSPEDCPLGNQDLLRLAHSDCVEDEDERAAS